MIKHFLPRCELGMRGNKFIQIIRVDRPMFEKSKELVSANSWAVWNWVNFLIKLEFNNSSSGTFPLRLSNFLSSSLKSNFIFIKTPPSPNSDYRTDRGLQQYENEWNKRLEKEEKITTRVAIVGLAVAISKEAREWYKATKKEKRQKPTRKRRQWRFSRGEG